MPYAGIIAYVLQSKEEEDDMIKDELARDEKATKHEVVQDNINRKFQMSGSGFVSQVFFST